jgi:hypothetical protein
MTMFMAGSSDLGKAFIPYPLEAIKKSPFGIQESVNIPA